MNSSWRSGGGRGGTKGGRGGAEVKAWKTIVLPSMPLTEVNRAEFYGPLYSNRSQLLIRRDDNGQYSIVPHTLKDWLVDGKTTHKSYWEDLNKRLNIDGTHASIREALNRLGFPEGEINKIDMKNVEKFSGVVAMNCSDKNVWEAFRTNLEKGMVLSNEGSLCSKLRYMCNESSNGTIHLLVNPKKGFHTADFVGGKLQFKEYSDYINSSQDMIYLFRSFMREMFEELNLNAPASEIETTTQSNGYLATNRFNCEREGKLLVSVELIQVAPFFVKIVVRDIIASAASSTAPYLNGKEPATNAVVDTSIVPATVDGTVFQMPTVAAALAAAESEDASEAAAEKVLV